MDVVAPLGPVYQAGTLSGNPIAMSAGLAMLHHLNDNPQVYFRLEEIGDRISDGFTSIDQQLGLQNCINQMGSMFTYFFTQKPVHNFEDAKTSDTTVFAQYFRAMLKQGIYLAPSQFESLFASTALTDAMIDWYLEAHQSALSRIMSQS